MPKKSNESTSFKVQWDKKFVKAADRYHAALYKAVLSLKYIKEDQIFESEFLTKPWWETPWYIGNPKKLTTQVLLRLLHSPASIKLRNNMIIDTDWQFAETRLYPHEHCQRIAPASAYRVIWKKGVRNKLTWLLQRNPKLEQITLSHKMIPASASPEYIWDTLEELYNRLDQWLLFVDNYAVGGAISWEAQPVRRGRVLIHLHALVEVIKTKIAVLNKKREHNKEYWTLCSKQDTDLTEIKYQSVKQTPDDIKNSLYYTLGLCTFQHVPKILRPYLPEKYRKPNDVCPSSNQVRNLVAAYAYHEKPSKWFGAWDFRTPLGRAVKNNPHKSVNSISN